MLSLDEIKLDRVLHGKSQEKLKEFPDNFFDSVITDPPYELGFMGKQWDASGITYSVDLWKEVLRTAKPGATLFCFGGSRTYHRVACAIEDAGWLLKDSLMWIYGCLSEDTEILTTDGWKKYHKDICKDSVLCYDVVNNQFRFDKPSQSFYYENKHTAFRVRSCDTDQIVSRNHRCLVERDGAWVFKRAEMCEDRENIPFLESLQSLSEAVYDVQSYTSKKKQDMFSRLSYRNFSADGSKQTIKRAQRKIKGYMYNLWQGVLQKYQTSCKSWGSFLFKTVQWCSPRRRVEAVCTYGQMGLDRRNTAGSQRKNDWRKQSGVERRSVIFQEKGQLWPVCNKVRQVSKRVRQYVTRRWICNGTSANNGSEAGPMLATAGSCSSFRPQSNEQQDGKFDVIQEQPKAQAIRSTRATITPIEYNGKVWCVQVSTGAFVARRNGKIFITGNSGFPKSTDISKQFDKEVGAKREVIGRTKSGGFKRLMTHNKEQSYRPEDYYPEGNKFVSETGVTDIAKQWQGYGTALKPAFEPIILAQKPLEKGLTYAQNARKWGVAGLNIDAGRISTDELQSRSVNATDSVGVWTKETCGLRNKSWEYDGSKGRWPSNVILSHSPDCVKINTSHEDGIEQETIDVYACVPDCPIRIMDSQSGQAGISEGASRFFYTAKASRSERESGLKDFMPCVKCGKIGTETHTTNNKSSTKENCIRNNHPTVKPIALMEYLCKLIQMPLQSNKVQVVLDPFCGSGSTLLAANKVGLKYIGIDMGVDNVLIASSRSIETVPDEIQDRHLQIDPEQLSSNDFEGLLV